MKIFKLWIIAAGILIAAFALFRFFWMFEQRQLQSEFDYIERTGRPSDALSKYSLICFNDNNGSEKGDFLRAATRAGHDIAVSVSRCGRTYSCCPLDMDSDLAGVIGLVRETEIDCMPIKYFAYVLEQKREACIAPSRLTVSLKKFEREYLTSGRPWVGKTGDRYYSIGER